MERRQVFVVEVYTEGMEAPLLTEQALHAALDAHYRKRRRRFVVSQSAGERVTQ